MSQRNVNVLGFGPFGHPKPDFDHYLKPSSIPFQPRYWDHEIDCNTLIKLPRPSGVSTQLKYSRDLNTGRVNMMDYVEVLLADSDSLRR